jgi:ribosomal-protein-alanine N-acetyltransferase
VTLRPREAREAVDCGVIVRRATEADVGAVVRLAEASANAAQWSSAMAMAYFAAEKPGNAIQAKAIFVARVSELAVPRAEVPDASSPSGNVVGFAAFSAVTSAGPGECSLENIVVADAWRNFGIGGRLLAAGMLWCRAQFGASVWLEVRASNHDAIALYERAGFMVVGRRPGYYIQPDEDAVEMRKILDDHAC